FVQRFGSSLNLNVHFHVVMLDGVFVRDAEARAIFHRAPPPSRDELEGVVERTRRRIRSWLTRHGYVDATSLQERTNDSPAPTSLEACADIAMRRGSIERNARWEEESATASSETAPPCDAEALARDGFNLHASVRIAADDDLGRERLCRYGARPPFSLERLRRLPRGELGYRIKKTRGGGSKVLRMTPLELLARLAALVPPPRYPLVRYHGVLAPRSPWRKFVVPRAPSSPIAPRHAHPEKSPGNSRSEDRETRSVSATRSGDKRSLTNAPRTNSSREFSEPSAALIAPNVIAVRHWERLCGGLLFATSPRVPWATLLRRTFEVDVLTCTQCSGRLRILGAVEDPVVARDILERLGLPTEAPAQIRARDPTLLDGDDEAE
ncbi:MAG: transposase, partial [Polyangiaceae bacterium]